MSDFSGLPSSEVKRPRTARFVGAVALVVSVLALLLVAALAWVLWELTDFSFSF